ncbi:MAG TPA: CoA transferase, partial [Acidimicrobiales bacterium]|nr:CoA transferase [Acidimicrobiales bacterium]
MSEGILDGIQVLDMARGISGSVAGLLLAEAGADVVKVEAAGDGPRPFGAEHGVRTWDRSKRRIEVDLATTGGKEALARLLARADVLIHELSPRRAADAGLDDASLAARYPGLIVSSVLSWPANHPQAEVPVDELLAMARLGLCDEQRAMRRSGPVMVRFPLGSWGAAYLAAIGIAARLLARVDTGRGGAAHTSLVQGALVPMGMHWSRAENPSPALAMGMPKEGGGSQISLFECADGEWIHLMKCPDEAPLMKSALEAMGEEGVRTANAAAGGNSFGYPNLGANAVAFRTRPSEDWLADFWSSDIPAQPALPFGQILRDEQAAANGYVAEVQDPEEGTITVPGVPLTTDPPSRIRFPRPAGTVEPERVAADWEKSRPEWGPEPRRAATSLKWPLEGLKVLDLGNYLAGPYGPMLMADLGADVVKVESTAGDAMRPTGWAFAGCQRGKRSVALDLKDPSSRPAIEALLGWADVVHHNLRMPAARRLGLDYGTVKEINPQVVYCHTSSYGPEGPRAEWPGYDQLFQAACGWEVLGAGEGNPPMWHRFGFMDHQCALASVVATLLALYRRRLTGQGSSVAASLLGAGVMTVSETYLRPDGSVAPVAGLDGDQTHIEAGYGIIPVSDGWVAVACRTEDQRSALARAAGVPGVEGVPSALAGWTRDESLGRLRAAGVPAEPVRERQRDAFFDDPDNVAAGLVARYRSAEWGRFEQPGAMWYLGDLTTRLELAPPALGEHTFEVLTAVGLAPEEVGALIDRGAARQYGGP